MIQTDEADKHPEREGYRQNFELAYEKMDASRREWLRNALARAFPEGHKWLDAVAQ